jgi:hypothetical protein
MLLPLLTFEVFLIAKSFWKNMGVSKEYLRCPCDLFGDKTRMDVWMARMHNTSLISAYFWLDSRECLEYYTLLFAGKKDEQYGSKMEVVPKNKHAVTFTREKLIENIN